MGVGVQRHDQAALPPRDTVPIAQQAGWAPRGWTRLVRKISLLNWDSIPESSSPSRFVIVFGRNIFQS